MCKTEMQIVDVRSLSRASIARVWKEKQERTIFWCWGGICAQLIILLSENSNLMCNS